jgi:hypothetical protein
MLAGMREAPFWPALEALAPTLVYDLIITRSLPAVRLPALTTPTLVIASQGSDDRLRDWAKGLAAALPNATLRMPEGEWHGIPAEELAPLLAEFFAA